MGTVCYSIRRKADLAQEIKDMGERFRENERIRFLYAAGLGRSDIVWNLLVINQDVHMFSIDARDPDGNTALMIATAANHEGVVYALLVFGADRSLCNTEGILAIDLAHRHSNIWYSLQVIWRHGLDKSHCLFHRFVLLECVEQVSLSPS
jgi:hypothetical protein